MNSRDEKRNQSRTRKNRIVFYVDDDELKFIQAKMKVLHIKNREAYLRKMAIDGQCVHYDYSDFEKAVRESNYLVSGISKNINQIAKRVNSTGNIYEEDLEEIRKAVDELIKIQREISKFFLSFTKEK